MIKLISLRAAKFKQLDDVQLAFPERGSVLVQGANEAGKSTLFESVFFALFGKALVTEDNAGKLDDLIHYESPRAVVRLAFSTDRATFQVSRSLNRGKANNAVLEIRYAGGKSETVTNLSAVNRRIVEELGLDGEALLNSCFVEQKKLEKLESMNAQQRRETLLRLLNLDRLSALEGQYKPASSDEYELQRQRDRLRLAEVQRDLPATGQRIEVVDRELRLIHGARLRAQVEELDRGVAAEQRDQEALREQESGLSAALAEVEGLKQVRDLARVAGETLVGIRQEEDELTRLDSEIQALRQDAARCPELQRKLSSLEAQAEEMAGIAAAEQRLVEERHRLERLDSAVTRAAELRQTLAERRQTLAAIETQLADARQDVEQADRIERQGRLAELLRSWLQIREVAHIAAEGQARLEALQSEASDLDANAAAHALAHTSSQRTAIGLTAATLVALVGGILALATGLAVGAAGLVIALIGAALSLRCWRLAETQQQRRRSAEASAAAVRMEVHRREGEQALAQRTGQDPARLGQIESELAALGAAVPATVEDAHAALDRLGLGAAPADGAPNGSGGTRSASEARHLAGTLEGQRDSVRAEIGKLEQQLEREGDVAAEAELVRAEIERAARDAAERRAAVGSQFADAGDVRAQAAAVRAALDMATDASRKAEGLAAAAAERHHALTARRAEFARSWEELAGLRPDVGQDVDACRQLWRECSDQLALKDEPGLRREAIGVSQQLAGSQERARAAGQRIALIQAELAELALDEAQLQAHAAPTAEDEHSLRSEKDELLGRQRSLRDQQAELERQLSLQGVELDYAEAVEALAAFEERLEVRRQAYRIVTLARRNIVGKVLPSTERNMGLLLPLLTNDRYRDVVVDPETYKIKVWDELARGMKAKDIFSGGTRDQFSLALRLAFALATLPEELGTAPGFIFLDEPLSSFDHARAEALVNLLTRGLIASNFEQIFVISHSRSFDEQQFDFHLQLESGRVAASDLPALPSEAGEGRQIGLALDAAPVTAAAAAGAGR